MDDRNAISRAAVSEETFPDELGPPQVVSDRVDDRFALAHEAAAELLAGYERDVSDTVAELLSCLDTGDLAFLSWSKRFSVAQSRMPDRLKQALETIMRRHDNSVFDIVPDVACAEFPASDLLRCMKQHLDVEPSAERQALEATLEPLLSLAREHQGGDYVRRITQQLLEQYLSVEERFQPASSVATERDIIYGLRQVRRLPACLLDTGSAVSIRNTGTTFGACWIW